MNWSSQIGVPRIWQFISAFFLMFMSMEKESKCSMAAVSPHTPQTLGSGSGGLSRRLPIDIFPVKILFANGGSESTLPQCAMFSVCNKVDIYDKPWIEKQCKCAHSQECSTSLSPSDGYTITEKTRHYKLCEPVRKLPPCRYFRDITWTLVTEGENLTQQIVNCECPKDSVAYMIRRQPHLSEDNEAGFKYSFACSPQTRVLCQRKEPCRLFTVKRRFSVDDVNTNALCHCPRGFMCPANHLDAGVIPGKFQLRNTLRTFSGYCIQKQ